MRWSVLVVASSLSSCLGSEVESQLTITQGLYGQLTDACEGEACLGQPRVGAPVGWFDDSPLRAGDDGGVPEPRSTSRTQENGFYELALEPATKGYFAIGSERSDRVVWFTATAANVPRGLGRLDWQASDDVMGVWKDVK